MNPRRLRSLYDNDLVIALVLTSFMQSIEKLKTLE
ncbi:hypothetical protein RIB2604_02000850 [Aspergillus luchuensis]|uniref:Uncharacterized protein n=1 Tax=Aspergillus kawachii TaxID=1069201 RepID=A0A146FIC5_ASPKA|nr:hypothetical protein RIB2604_02000850 [Aspergillus luchuensis]